MLLENLGIDKAIRLGKPEDWKAAIAELETQKDMVTELTLLTAGLTSPPTLTKNNS
ncbi:MAG: hypothetical protein QOE96_2177 [Blastocatellia bacterium]|jgi:hypothetical protein|nr:hypothetical protein [Blastocatellia bacterium]